MVVRIRPMKVEDIPDVKRVDLITWGDLIKKEYPDIIKMTSRTDENILSYLHSNAEGAFVAVDELAGIIASVFSHVWGRTGWVGPLSVLPSYQGRGVGKELLRFSLRYLEDSRCSDIGLETMPENQANLGMYFRAGLKHECLVLVLGKRLDSHEPPEERFGDVVIERYSESKAKDKLSHQIRKVSGFLSRGLDYTPEVELTDEYRFGDTLVATQNGDIAGFCVLHTTPRREQMPCASIRMLGVDPAKGHDVSEHLLTAAEIMAVDAKCPEMSLPVPSVCRRALDIAFSKDYQVTQSYARLMWMGSSGATERITNLCSWSG